MEPNTTHEALRALANPVRFSIVEALASNGEMSVGRIQKILQDGGNYSQSAVSQHLAVLRREELVQVRRDGTHIFYRQNREKIASLSDAIGQLKAA